VIGIEVDAMKVANREAELKNEYPSPYNFEDFMELAFKVGEIADKFRKLGGTK
jgi:hypothetical protein